MAETFFDRLKAKNDLSETTEPQLEVEAPTTTPEPEVVPELKETETTTTPDSEIPKEEKSFDVGSINEYYGTSFENADSLKEIFESQSKYKDLDSQLVSKSEELSNAHNKYNSLLDAIDPEKVLPNKEAVALSQLADKYPNADIGMLSSIRKADLAAIDKLEALVMLDKLTVPSQVSDSIRKAEILRGLGIDEDITELSEQDRYRIEREFTTKGQQLEEIKGFQPELKTFDFEAERTQRQQLLDTERKTLETHNEKALKILGDDFKSIKDKMKIGDKEFDFEYQVGSDFLEKNFQYIVDNVTNSGVKITNENANSIKTEIVNYYKIQNWDNIVKDYLKQALSGEKEQVHSEIHSDSPTNKTEPQTNTPVPQKTVMEHLRSGNLKRR